MMNDTIYNNVCPGSRLAGFIAEYAAWLWGCGATCERIDKNISRIAGSYGYQVNLSILPGSVTAVISGSDAADHFVACHSPAPCGIDYSVNTALSALSWRICDRNMPLDTAISEFRAATAVRHLNPVVIIVLTSLANASFCRLFGGDAAAMSVVFAATLAGYFVKHSMLCHHIDVRIAFLVSAFVSSVICSGSILQGWSSTPDVALATGVLYLIPGVPYLNAAADLISRNYLCALCRAMDAVVLTAMLSAGLSVGIFVMKVNLPW